MSFEEEIKENILIHKDIIKNLTQCINELEEEIKQIS
jgi:hypothetical protein